MPVLLRMHVPGLLSNPLALQLAMLVLLRMHAPGLPMNLLALPLPVLVLVRTQLPVPLMNPVAVPLAMLIPLGMHVPGSRMSPRTMPEARMMPRGFMPSHVVAMDDQRTIVECPHGRGEADRGWAFRPIVDCRNDQTADGATHDRTLPRPSRIGPNGRRRHGRAERDGSHERDSSDEAVFPALSHRHPPLSIGSLRRGASSC